MDIESIHVWAYLDHRSKDLGRIARARTHFSAIKSLFQYLAEKEFLASNPAASVAYSFVDSRKGKTAIISSEDIRLLLLSIPDDPNNVERPAKQTDLRDKALIGLMTYTFVRIGGALVRIGGALSANVGDFRYDDGTHVAGYD